MKYPSLILCLTLFAASSTVAHVGVENPAVMVRMHAMKNISDNMKVLVQMNKGERPFNAAEARAAATEITDDGMETPALFEIREDDPKSEAKPEIWENFADFTSKADALVTVASDMSQSLQTFADLQQTVPELGQTCLACHDKYRIKK